MIRRTQTSLSLLLALGALGAAVPLRRPEPARVPEEEQRYKMTKAEKKRQKRARRNLELKP